MRMSHIYQPAMLAILLRNGGKCSESEIAEEILKHDQSQIVQPGDIVLVKGSRSIAMEEIVAALQIPVK